MRYLLKHHSSNLGFAIRDLLVAMTCTLVIAVGLLSSLAGANRDLSQASMCTSNLEMLFDGLTAYVNAYNSFPPNSPFPDYFPSHSEYRTL